MDGFLCMNNKKFLEREKFENKIFKLLINGSTASIDCGMQEYKFERKTFKLLIGGSTASNACSMQGYKYGHD